MDKRPKRYGGMSGSRRERDPERAWTRDRGRKRGRTPAWERVDAADTDRSGDHGFGRFRRMAGTDSLSELEELDLQDRER